MRHATDDPVPVGDPRHEKPFPGFNPLAEENSCEKVISNALQAGAKSPDESKEGDCKCPDGYRYTAIHMKPANGDPRGDDVHVDRYNCAGQPNPGWWRKLGMNPATNTTSNPVSGKPYGEDLTDPSRQPPRGYTFCDYLCLKSAS